MSEPSLARGQPRGDGGERQLRRVGKRVRKPCKARLVRAPVRTFVAVQATFVQLGGNHLAGLHESARVGQFREDRRGLPRRIARNSRSGRNVQLEQHDCVALHVSPPATWSAPPSPHPAQLTFARAQLRRSDRPRKRAVRRPPHATSARACRTAAGVQPACRGHGLSVDRGSFPPAMRTRRHSACSLKVASVVGECWTRPSLGTQQARRR